MRSGGQIERDDRQSNHAAVGQIPCDPKTLCSRRCTALSRMNISIKELLSDIRNGMNEYMIRQKYGLESGHVLVHTVSDVRQ